MVTESWYDSNMGIVTTKRVLTTTISLLGSPLKGKPAAYTRIDFYLVLFSMPSNYPHGLWVFILIGK
jgi:hypothetical protein